VFLGHGLVAFAGAAGVASLLGYGRERALALGICAGAFALAPDVDILYAPVGLAEAASNGGDPVAGFWRGSNRIHRAVTHSLVVGSVVSLAVGCWAWALRGRRTPEGPAAPAVTAVLTFRQGPSLSGLAALMALSLLGGAVALALVENAPLGAAVMTAFALTSLAIATLAARWGLSAREIALVALLGLSSHPFGDLFTGEPPAFLYPFDATFLAERVALHPDPTLHLLGAFGVELATFWAAALVYASLSESGLRASVDWPAVLGVGYAGAVLALPAPTLDSSYRFVLSVLGLGTVLGAVSELRSWAGAADSSPRFERPTPRGGRSIVTALGRVLGACRRATLDDPFSAALTGLTAVTLALGAYTVTYVATAATIPPI
jgi:membrane-bound metal-dependent hydrolase YbcI (DUF457 family)